MEELDLSSKSLRALAKLKKFGCTISYVDAEELNFILIEHRTGDDYLDPNEDDLDVELTRLVKNLEKWNTIYGRKKR